jgi:hypothetical protein
MLKYDGMVSGFGFIIVIIALIGAATGATLVLAGGEESTPMEWVEKEDSESKSGSTTEGQDSEVELNLLQDKITKVEATLTWQDEALSGIGSRKNTNEPDVFSISLTTPSGVEEEGGQSNSGSTSVSYSVPEETPEEPGIWIFTVTCIDAGDIVGVGGYRVVDQDNGNAWNLEITITYDTLEEKTTEESTFDLF